ncbi:GNAT family N-acetyltransferase [Streptomyces sp. NPDC020192]|uniref:GNAT family N-acetyltransferase n=1 Tax=Streptomyces sp. NPDC020192 TaxID=3365066 RepID=UPI0037B09173
MSERGHADGDARGAGRRGHAYAYLLGPVEKGAGLRQQFLGDGLYDSGSTGGVRSGIVALSMTNSQVFLRAARLDDVDSITDLHTLARTAYYRAGGVSEVELTSLDARDSRREPWTRAVQADDRTVLCAHRGDEIVGVLAMGPPHDADVDVTSVGQLHQIHVCPGLWGQGIGDRLHAAFVQFLRDASLREGVLEAWERNSRAQAFYAGRGWKPDGHHRPGPGGARYVRMRLNAR